jgi:hypothetical protein
MASQDEPLINNADDGDPAQDDLDHDEVGKTAPGDTVQLFVWLLTLSAGISGLLFGCIDPLLPAGPMIMTDKMMFR